MADWPYNTRQWARLRHAKLAHEPLCYACKLLGRVRPAEAVDHVQPINQGGDAFPPLEGLMSLCMSHHNEKTAGFDRVKGDTHRRFKGCDADGNPIDPLDPWHGGTTDHGVSGPFQTATPSQTDLLSRKRSPKVVL